LRGDRVATEEAYPSAWGWRRCKARGKVRRPEILESGAGGEHERWMADSCRTLNWMINWAHAPPFAGQRREEANKRKGKSEGAKARRCPHRRPRRVTGPWARCNSTSSFQENPPQLLTVFMRVTPVQPVYIYRRDLVGLSYLQRNPHCSGHILDHDG
jgi:hypothetical protein